MSATITVTPNNSVGGGVDGGGVGILNGAFVWNGEPFTWGSDQFIYSN